MKACKYGSCKKLVTDINPKTKKTYYYCETHRKKRNKINKKRYDSEKGDQIRARNRKYINGLRDKFMKQYGGRCECCGTSYDPFLTLDHVDGGGNKDRANKNNSRIYLDAMKVVDKNKYQILCMNCNLAKSKSDDQKCHCQDVLVCCDYEDYRDN